MRNFLGTKKLWHAYLSTGSSYLRLPDGHLLPINQNGAQLQYNARSQTPSSVKYYTGHFGADGSTRGRAHQSQFGCARLFSLEADDTIHRLDSGSRSVQWLERASFAYQTARTRRSRSAYEESSERARVCGAGSVRKRVERIGCVSRPFAARRALRRLRGSSAFSTVPQLVIKVIHYFGAGKGT